MPFDPLPLGPALTAAAARHAGAGARMEAALATLQRLYTDLPPAVWTTSAGYAGGAVPLAGLDPVPAPLAPPTTYCVIATDASAIRPDRHAGVACALVTVGQIMLAYGPDPAATLDTLAHHYGPGPASLARRLPGLCAHAERAALARLAATTQPDLALLDGPLLPRPLRPGAQPLPATLLTGGVPVVGYISAPHTSAVLRTLRAACCPVVAAGGPLCGGGGVTPCPDSPCGALVGVPDARLFAGLLPAGARSPLFLLPTPPHARVRGPAAAGVGFCYLHTPTEVARLDVPLTLTDQAGALDRLHGIVLRQCALGDGYPRVLALAHQFAVLTSADRAAYFALLDRYGLAGPPSAKALGKARLGGRI